MAEYRSGGTFSPAIPDLEPYSPTSEKEEKSAILKTCAICRKSLGLGLGVIHPKNKFCHRDVCKKCSLNRRYHPDLHVDVRCCDSCFRNEISSLMDMDFRSQIMQEEQHLDDTVRKLGNEQALKVDLIETQVSLVKIIKELTGNVGKQREKLELKLTITKDNLVTVKETRSKIEAKRLEIQGKLALISRETQENKANVEERKAALEVSKREILDLKGRLAALQDDFQSMGIMLESSRRPLPIPGKKETLKDLKRLLKEYKDAESALIIEIDLLKDQLSSISRSEETPTFTEAETSEIEQLSSEMQKYLRENEEMRLELRRRGEIGRHYAEYMSSHAGK